MPLRNENNELKIFTTILTGEISQPNLLNLSI